MTVDPGAMELWWQLMQGFAGAGLNYFRLDSSIPFQHSNDDGLAFECAVGFESPRPLRLVHILCLTAYKRLVHLYLTRERRGVIVLHHHPQPVQHEPSRFLRNSDGTVNFIRRDTVLAVGKHPESTKPLIKSKRGVLEDSANLETELLFAPLTKPHPPGAQKTVFITPAARTRRPAVWPAKLLRILKAADWIREVNDGLLECLVAVHIKGLLRIVL